MKSLSKLFVGGIAVIAVALTVLSFDHASDIKSSGIGIRSYLLQDAPDTVNNSTTFVNSDLTFALAANQSVHVRYSLPFRLTALNSGIKFQITAPSGFVAYSSAIVIYSVGDSVAFVQVGATPNAQGLTGLPTGSSITNIDLDIVNGATAGNVTLQFAQNAAVSGDAILLRGAYADITKR